MTSDEATARFLNAVAGRVAPEHVEAVHLFQPIKQGGTESRVAVVVVRESPSVAGGPGAGARHAVYTATYRLTLKGPERGKWDFTMQAEADAPLVTVDAVVRGVQRRSGDAEDPAKLSGDEFRALLAEATA